MCGRAQRKKKRKKKKNAIRRHYERGFRELGAGRIVQYGGGGESERQRERGT